MDWSVGHESVFVCVRITGVPGQLEREGREEEGDGDESVSQGGAEDGGLYGIEGCKVKSLHQRQGHSFLSHCTIHTSTD